MTELQEWRRREIIILAMLACALVGVSCDGFLAVEGRVYARPADSSRPSTASVDGDIPDTAGLKPLPGAAVWVFQRAADTTAARPDTMPWVDTDTTGPDGSFHAGSVASPSRFTAALRVQRTGYRSVTVPFEHGGAATRHRAVVVLTPAP